MIYPLVGYAEVGGEKIETVIPWDAKRSLTWDDFKANRKPHGKVPAALSTCGFGFEATEENGKVVLVQVHVSFYPDKSWKNKKHLTKEVLAHEQLHFNITELMGRKFHQEILALAQKGKLNQRTLKRSYDRISKEHSQLQELYDKQTNHSLNVKLQAWWARYLEAEIVKTALFSGYHQINCS